MKYFKLEEFVKSDTAKKHNIDNTPSVIQINNINVLVDNILDPLREDWAKYCEDQSLGKGSIRVTSGIRSKRLNELVGGSPSSSHYIGYAADIVPTNGKMKEFKEFVINWLKDKEFDQMISESEDEKGVPSWIHIGWKNNSNQQRRRFMGMKNNKYYYI